MLAIVFKINIKKIKKIGENKELDNLTEKYPSNIEICKAILKMLNNQTVIVEENKDSNTSLYIAISNKISIANVRNSFTRIQTIAHECLHSVQDRKILLFNFCYSNIYLIYFLIITILAIFKKLPYEMTFLNILIILGFVYYFVRSYLENDAMIKARFLAKEYMEKQNISSKEEIDKIVNEYDKLNNVGIKCVNYNLFFNTIIKDIIFILILFIL
jgi:hypothetical protein